MSKMKHSSGSMYAVILAGGSGVRLWPLSREALPKQLIPVLGGKSLLEAAFERLKGVIPPQRRWVCGGERYEDVVRAKIPALGRYIGEPEGRDTLAAIGLSCALVHKEDPDGIVAFLTSDHVIEPVSRFRQALRTAFETVKKGSDPFLTFGIAPSFAATAYGYLELGEPLAGAGPGIRRVRRFREKPDRATAERFVAEGPERYLWNSGMFVFKASRFLELLSKYEPHVAEVIGRIALAESPGQQTALMRELYPTITKKSVDYGIMEPASQDPEATIACIPLDLEWKDIGSWTAYGSLASPDAQGNRAMLAAAARGRRDTAARDQRSTAARTAPPTPAALFKESTESLVVSSEEDHLIACLGCEDLVVIHTPDATLVCPRSRVEDIKKLHPDILAAFGGKFI